MDEKQKKVDTGKALLGTYQKEKQEKVHGRGGDHGQSEHTCDSYSQVLSGKMALETKKNKMDVASLHKKTVQFQSLNTTIKVLEDTLSEKDEIIKSLKIENTVLRQGNGDSISTSEKADNKMIRELQKMVDDRDTFIKQLSDSLTQRSEELKHSTLKEKELTQELHILEQKMETLSKHYELKLSDSFNEAVEFKGKTEQLANQIQDYSNLVHSLRVALETSSKKIDCLQKELNEKNKKIDVYKNKSSEEIQMLMRQVELLNNDLAMKEKEVYLKNKKIEQIHNQIEESFGNQLVSLKKELEQKYTEDIQKVEKMYDELMLKQLRTPGEDNKVIEKCKHLETQISSCKLKCEEEIQNYREELKELILKSKSTEDRLMEDLERHKTVADHYRQQVENVENKVSEEVQKVKNECYLVIEKLEDEMNEKMVQDQERIGNYQQEIDKLCVQLKDNAVKEARTEIEIESCREQLVKRESDINSLMDNLDKYKVAYEEQKITIAQLEKELFQYQNIIAQYKSAEQIFQQNEQELLFSKAKLLEYEQKVYEFNEKIKLDSERFNEKYNAVAKTFQIQTQQHMSELERNKIKYEDDLLRLTSITNEQQNEIKNLEAKIAYILEVNKSETEDFEVLNDQSTQINMIKQQLLSVNKVKETSNSFLLNILKGLRKIKQNLKVIIGFSSENCLSKIETSEIENNEAALSYEELVVELEKTLCDIKNATEYSPDSANLLTGSPNFVQNQNMITSTPCVKGYLGVGFSSQILDYQSDQGSCGDFQSWVNKCAVLETEKEKLSKDLISVLQNQKEMEYCLLVATQEAKSFNEKCQSLDAKITELENSKLSDHLLKRENYDLKTKIIALEQNEQRLHQELQKAGENYIKSQHMFNDSISDLQKELTKHGSNLELEHILVDLKLKSEEVIALKAQIANLLKSEQECKARAIDIQNKYEQFITKHKFLESELSNNKIELNNIFQEKNQLISENKALQSQLKIFEDKTNVQNVGDNKTSTSSFIGGMHLNSKINGLAKERESLSSDFSSLSASRLQTMELLAASHNTSNNHLAKTLPSGQSIADQINLHLQQLDQSSERTLGYHMPTILEDVEEEVQSSPRTNKEHSQVSIN